MILLLFNILYFIFIPRYICSIFYAWFFKNKVWFYMYCVYNDFCYPFEFKFFK